MDRRTQPPQGPPRRDPPVDGRPDPDPQPPPPPQGRPSLSVGPAFARTVGHFFPDLNAWLDTVPDTRDQNGITYSGRFLLWCGLLLFVGKLGSRRQLDFKSREPGSCVLANLNRLAQTDHDSVPCNDTLDDYLAGPDAAGLAPVRASMINRLIRMRALDSARVQGRLVAGIDGT